jgi:hypothetical protein
MTETKTYGVAWVKGSDPSDGGWAFDGGAVVNGYALAYEAETREAAEGLGVPDTILDLFEKENGGDYDNGGLFDWLQQRSDLFRT